MILPNREWSVYKPGRPPIHYAAGRLWWESSKPIWDSIAGESRRMFTQLMGHPDPEKTGPVWGEKFTGD